MFRWSCKLVLASMVHTRTEIRDITTSCKGKIKEWFERRYSNVALVKAVEAVGNNASLDASQKHLCKVTLVCFKRNGVHLSQEQREKLVALKAEISKKEYEFQKNLGEDLSQEECNSLFSVNFLI